MTNAEICGKIFVLTGLDAYVESKTTKRITENGGIVKNSVVLATNILVSRFTGSLTRKTHTAP